MCSLPAHARCIGQVMSARPNEGSVDAALLETRRAFHRVSYNSHTSTARCFSRTSPFHRCLLFSTLRPSRLLLLRLACIVLCLLPHPPLMLGRVLPPANANIFFSSDVLKEAQSYSPPHPRPCPLCVVLTLYIPRVDIQLVVHPPLSIAAGHARTSSTMPP